jgi:glycosyltransferase involved in cell wall biosynthesis
MTHANAKSILIFISSLSSGGAERVAVNQANYWAEKGWRVILVTLSNTSNDFYQIAPSIQRIALSLTGESSNTPLAIVSNLRRVFALRSVLRRTRPEIALAMMDKSNILLAMAAYGLHGLVAVGSEHIHPPQLPLSPMWASLRRYWYGHLAAVTTLTHESKDWLLINTPRVKRVAVIPNAVPWPLPSQPPILRPLDLLTPKRQILLAVGRLCHQKGFDLLIEAFQRLASVSPQWDLVILGEGPLRAELELQINQAGLTNRVHLLGRVGNLTDWYNAASLYVMSSRFEGFGNTLAEALAHGVPAVSFDCDTGPRDIIRHDIDGLLVPNSNVDALTHNLNQMMRDKSLREKFRPKAVEARERFSMGRISGMWEVLFIDAAPYRHDK